jgi:hypothetical protein
MISGGIAIAVKNRYIKDQSCASIRESSFQARVIVVAKMNGWRIDVGDTQECHKDTTIYRWLNHFFRGKM